MKKIFSIVVFLSVLSGCAWGVTCIWADSNRECGVIDWEDLQP